ncbi:MAG: ABC transporter ATP-binding protein [Saprospiraceae bacterium]|nr:ABC transporter ATP-binding protein [Pyrinomonadaceae bacterium]
MLEVRDIFVSYGNRDVLRDISLTLEGGKMIALLGANGAGKTTLVRALNGILPVSKGEILIDGKPFHKFSRREIAQKVAVVAQENETKFPVTVLEFVLAGRFASGGAFGWESEKDFTASENALLSCDLASFSDRFMNELSGGERQRVVLARALATEANILLLDEPTANLDLAHQGSMFRLIRERCRTGKYSAIVITHDLNLAAEFADEIVLLKDGRICAKGAPSDVLTVGNLVEVFGVRVLLDANPASGKVRVTTVY